MSWNDSGGSNNQDPWSGKNKNQGPPDLDKVIRDLVNKFSRLLGGKTARSGGGDTGKSFTVSFVAVLAVFAIIWVLSGIFIVSPEQEAVVLRFGKYQSTVEPGPHWIPRFISSYEKVNTQAIHAFQMQADLLTKSSDQSDKPKSVVNVEEVEKQVGSSQSPMKELSESDIDKNVVYVELGIQYKIGDPKEFLYHISNPEQTIKQAAESALSQVVGTMKLDSVLTSGRSELSQRVLVELRKIVDSYESGLSVLAVNVRKAQAPEEVADAFLEVAQAGQDGQRFKQQAEAYASKVVPLAMGNASRIKANAKAYQQEIILASEAATAKYKALVSVYQQSPGVTRERMYLDMVQYVLSHSSKVMVDAAGDGNNNVFYLPLDKMVGQKPMPDDLDVNVNTTSEKTPVISKPASGYARSRTSLSTTRPDYLSRGD